MDFHFFILVKQYFKENSVRGLLIVTQIYGEGTQSLWDLILAWTYL